MYNSLGKMVSVIIIGGMVLLSGPIFAQDAVDRSAQDAAKQAADASNQLQGVGQLDDGTKTAVNGAVGQLQQTMQTSQALPNGLGAGSMNILADMKAAAQKGLTMVGQGIQKASGMIDKAAQALEKIGAALSASQVGAAIGKVLEKMGKALARNGRSGGRKTTSSPCMLFSMPIRRSG